MALMILNSPFFFLESQAKMGSDDMGRAFSA